MRPILMKGHERPLTFLRYNRDGDLLFSCAKDHTPNVWFADNGDRLGTYSGHNGAVWSCDTAKLWDVQTGRELFTFRFDAPARSVEFAIGDGLAVITTDNFMENVPTAQVKRIAEDPDDQSEESLLVITGIKGRINRAVWGPLNRTIITAGEDATIRIWDTETGQCLKESDKEQGHQKTITSLSKSADWSHFLTGSLDKSAKLWDTRTLTLIKTYVTERPVNAVDISPLLDHILQEEIGGVKGHFGPINALAFNPDGRR
uniref:Serine-threonine kinase receptor-associated protein n=1 Tax=Oryza rufipogon TaxID=4529 RepID=A0A0E0QH71_ORYRU